MRLFSLTISLVLNHSSWLYGIMGPLLAVITHSLLNDYVVVEQPSVGAVNCCLLCSKNRLTNSRGGRGRESIDLGGLILYIWWDEENDYISENGQVGAGELWYSEAAVVLNESERLSLTAWKYSIRPLEDELLVCGVCLMASCAVTLFQTAVKLQGSQTQWLTITVSSLLAGHAAKIFNVSQNWSQTHLDHFGSRDSADTQEHLHSCVPYVTMWG